MAEARIRDSVQAALEGDLGACLVDLPPHFRLEIEYHRPTVAHGPSFYPGAHLRDERAVSFESDDYFEILRAVRFLI